jgi:hypothetical protein
MPKEKEMVYPRGDLTIYKIVQNYYDLMEFAGAIVLAKAFFCYPEYQEYWMKVKFKDQVCWVSGRFGLNVPSDMMLSELSTAYAIPENYHERLKRVGQAMIKQRPYDQEKALEMASVDLASNPDRKACIEFLKKNAIGGATK